MRSRRPTASTATSSPRSGASNRITARRSVSARSSVRPPRSPASAAARIISARSCSRRWRSSRAATCGPTISRDRGPAPLAPLSSCRPRSSAMPSTSIATAAATSSIPCPTSSPRPPNEGRLGLRPDLGLRGRGAEGVQLPARRPLAHDESRRVGAPRHPPRRRQGVPARAGPRLSARARGRAGAGLPDAAELPRDHEIQSGRGLCARHRPSGRPPARRRAVRAGVAAPRARAHARGALRAAAASGPARLRRGRARRPARGQDPQRAAPVPGHGRPGARRVRLGGGPGPAARSLTVWSCGGGAVPGPRRGIFKLTFLAYYSRVTPGRPWQCRRRPRYSADRQFRRRLTMSPRFKFRAFAVLAVAAASLALLLPAQAQFWDWGGRPQRQQQYYNNNNNWFGGQGGWFGQDRRYQEREAPVDYSRAPPPSQSQKKPEATTSIVVMGDANADWLAYGLEDAFSEKPEVAIVRKHRTDSGLIRYDPRRDIEWPQVAREIIAAEKPQFIVMMIGNNDRQTIREKAPPPPPRGAAAPKGSAPQAAQQPAQPAAPQGPPPPPDAEQQPSEPAQAAEQHPNMTPEQARQANYGPWEFRSEKWELAYIKRIDATIAALKSAGVPVLWVGLASQRGTKASQDSAYLNELYRSRAEKAGIVYVDIWDGFVDEAGRYSPQGPDYEGQIRRLRSGDGVYFTKFGARKLAHYVEREIQRITGNKGLPVAALPMPVDPGPQEPAKPGVPAQRPSAGPVVPLTVSRVAPEELLGGGRAVPAAA